MDSGMIGKIEKAHRYASEPERFAFEALRVRVRGDNDAHTVTLADDRWQCECRFFQTHATCAHTMSIEQVLRGMVPASAVLVA